MKFIGITGHRGSGKTSIAYLLGNILNELSSGSVMTDIEILFPKWCETIKLNNNAIYDCPLYNVYFDEFGEMPKSFVAQLLSIDMSVLDSDTLKDTMYVNMNNFKLYNIEEADKSLKIITAEDILKNTSKKWKECYISLREFTKALSIDIMKKYFGDDVWLKTRVVNDEKFIDYDECMWKVFSDVKSKEEIKYIKDRNGIIIKTNRPSHKKRNSGITNTEDCVVDYIISTEGALENLFDTLYNIAIDIYEKNNDNTV